MLRNKLRTALLMVGLYTLAACPSPQPITPQLIPPGYGFPGQREEIQGWADKGDVANITNKAWNLWAGLNAGSGQTSSGAALPIWETWCGPQEAFGKTCNSFKRPPRPFRNAHQLNHFPTTGGNSTEQRLVSFTKFNTAMVGYLAQQHQGPGEAQYDYTQQTSLAQLNSAWLDTPTADRMVQETPYVAPSGSDPGAAAMELKPVLFLVKQQGLTPVPLWQGLEGSNDTHCQEGPSAQCHPEPGTWSTCVLVDPNSPEGADTPLVPATADQLAHVTLNPQLACATYLYAPLATLYSFQMDATEAALFNSAQGEAGLTAASGDYAVLVAMHVNTKEIVNWTWQTFWWQPGGDPPNNFPGSKQGVTSNVTGAARNYAMCTAYKQTQGKDSQDMVVCFNPYLETSRGIPDGVQSNCMSCHGMATVNSIFSLQSKNSVSINFLHYPPHYQAPIDFDHDPQFAHYTRTDFSWAIPLSSNPPAK